MTVSAIGSGLVLDDLDVGILRLEVGDDLVEVLERLAFELEEVQRRDAGLGVGRTASQCDDHGCCRQRGEPTGAGSGSG